MMNTLPAVLQTRIEHTLLDCGPFTDRLDVQVLFAEFEHIDLLRLIAYLANATPEQSDCGERLHKLLEEICDFWGEDTDRVVAGAVRGYRWLHEGPIPPCGRGTGGTGSLSTTAGRGDVPLFV